MVPLPSVFISHGSPMHALEAGPAGLAWAALGKRMGKPFTVADAYAFVLLGWTKPTQIDLAKWPNLGAFHKRVGARPKVQEALRAEGLLPKEQQQQRA